MIRRLRLFFRLGVLVLALTIAGVVYQANRMLERHAEGGSVEGTHDAALVLGSGIESDGLIAYSGRRRVRAGADLYHAGKVSRLILSDGSRNLGSRKGAQGMADYALSLGVPRDALLLELGSTSTFENILYAQAIATEHGLTRIVLVTDDMHLTRSALLADYLGLEISGMVAADARRGLGPFTTWPAYLRETLAWWYNLYKVAAWSLLGHAGWSVEDREDIVD